MDIRVTNKSEQTVKTFKDSKMMVATNGTIFIKTDKGVTLFASGSTDIIVEVV